MFWIKNRQLRKRSVPELQTEQKKVALLSEICDQVCRDKRGGCPEVKIDPFQDLQVTWARVKVAGLGGGDHPRSPHPLNLTEGYEHVDISKLVFSSTYILKYQLERKEWGMVGGK